MLSFPTCFQYFTALLFTEHQPRVEKIVANQLQMMMTCWMPFCLVSHLKNVHSTPASPLPVLEPQIYCPLNQRHTLSKANKKICFPRRFLIHIVHFMDLRSPEKLMGKTSLTEICGTWINSGFTTHISTSSFREEGISTYHREPQILLPYLCILTGKWWEGRKHSKKHSILS